MSSFSGYMLANQAGDTFTVTDIAHPRPEVAGGPSLVFRDTAFGIRQCGEYVLNSPVPLADEPETEHGRYSYQLFIVRGRAKLIMLAPRRRMVDYALAQIFDRTISPRLRKINVYIEKVIDYCARADAQFLVSSLHGRFSGASRDVRSLSLYGDDVTSSAIFAEHRDFFNFHSCGLGRRLFDGLPRLRANEEGEIVRLSHDGFLNLNLTSRRDAQELIRVVDFVVQSGWVEDWVPRREEEA